MRSVIVTRFSVPRPGATAELHADPAWLARRLELFRRFTAPSVERLGVPVVLLCSSRSAGWVEERTGDLAGVRVTVQDDWHGGWTGSPDQLVTRLDSDDAVHAGWVDALEAAPDGFEVYCTKRFYRFDVERRGLYLRRRLRPSPLAAFRGGANPYVCDHEELERRYRAHTLPGAYLLQTVHGGNLSNRRPRWWHVGFRVSRDRLAPFGVA